MQNLLKELEEELKCNGYSLCDILYASCIERSEPDSLFSHRVVLRPEVFIRAAEKINYDPFAGDPKQGVFAIDPLVKVVLKDGSYVERRSHHTGEEYWHCIKIALLNPTYTENVDESLLHIQWIKSGNGANE